jgi:TolB-like protein/ribosomal protein L31
MVKSKIMISVLLIVGNVATVFGAQSSLDQRVSELSQQIASKMSARQKTTLAVIEFANLRGEVTDFGRYLAEELITRLSDLEKFKVIERQLINRVIAEQKLGLTGIVDPAAARRLGRLLGADAICSGTVSDLAQGVKVNARLISTETGEVFASASTEIFKDESVLRLLANGSRTTPTANTDSSPSAANQNLHRKVDVSGFTFELKNVSMSGTAVTCEVGITSNDTDREITIEVCEVCHPSTMTDDNGNHHRVGQVRLGNKTTDYFITSLLVAGVPVRAVLRFEGVSPEARNIALLNINFRFDSRPLTAQFRSISL